MAQIPVISSHVLHGLPALVRHQIGERALLRANSAAGFDVELVDDRNCYIPQAAVIGFVNAAAKAAGESNLGFLLAPVMNVANYGAFGRYVLGADTLGQSLERTIAALCYHSTYDRMSVALVGDEARYSYVFALAGHAGYEMIAGAAAGVLLSVLRTFLPVGWRPKRIELDIDKPRQSGWFEAAFQCPLIFKAPAVTIVMNRHDLEAARRSASWPTVTIEDVARDCRGSAPRHLLDVVVEQIRTQVISGSVSIDNAAQSMDISIRTLQRELNRAGTDFRSLANAARLQRASELLRHTNGSVTRVSAEMGYSSPANFARAFRKATGHGPREFRAKI